MEYNENINLSEKINQAINIIKENIDDSVCVIFTPAKRGCVLKHLIENSIQDRKFLFYFLSNSLESDIVRNFIKTNYPDVKYLKTNVDVFELIKQQQKFPTVENPFCCKNTINILEEYLNKSYFCHILADRRNNPVCKYGKNIAIHPLSSWTNEDIDEYIEKYNLPVCETYKLYNSISQCFICLTGSSFNREKKIERIKHHPKEANKLKEALTYCWENNQELQNRFSTSEDYWEYFLSYNPKEEKEKLKKK